jgi:hypothetical protein
MPWNNGHASKPLYSAAYIKKIRCGAVGINLKLDVYLSPFISKIVGLDQFPKYSEHPHFFNQEHHMFC